MRKRWSSWRSIPRRRPTAVRAEAPPRRGDGPAEEKGRGPRDAVEERQHVDADAKAGGRVEEAAERRVQLHPAQHRAQQSQRVPVEAEDEAAVALAAAVLREAILRRARTVAMKEKNL